MGHQIAHRFAKTFKVMATCYYCSKPIYFGTGLKCKECKYQCHRECEDKVTPSCGLPPELLDEFKRKCPIEGQGFPSPNSGRSTTNHKNNIMTRTRKRSYNQPSINIPPFVVGFEVVWNLVGVSFFCFVLFYSHLILVRLRRVATVQRHLVQLYNRRLRHIRVVKRSFIFLVGAKKIVFFSKSLSNLFFFWKLILLEI